MAEEGSDCLDEHHHIIRVSYIHFYDCLEFLIMEYCPGFLYAVGWIRHALSVIGVWPESNETFFTKLRAFYCSIWIFVVVYLPLTASLAVVWGNLDAVIGCLSINGTVILAIAKILVFWHYRDTIRMLIDEMNNDWLKVKNKEEHDAMMKFAKISRIISISSVILGSTLFISFIVFQVYTGMAMRGQPNSDPRMSVGLLYPVYLPYSTRKKETFVPTWLAQCVSTIFSTTMYAGFDTFFSTIVLHICGQLAVVGLSLKNLHRGNYHTADAFQFQKKLSSIIKRHQKLYDLVDVVQVLFSLILLPQMLLCTVIFCFQGYVMIISILGNAGGQMFILQTVFIIIYVCYTVLHLFVYCYVGDHLIVQSVNVGWNFYKSHWYNLHYRQARLLMIIGYHSQKPLVITAANFCVFSRNLFLKVLKSSCGYLSMLLTIKNRLSANSAED